MSERERLHSLSLNRRRFLVGAAAAAASAVLAACGGGSTAPTATTSCRDQACWRGDDGERCANDSGRRPNDHGHHATGSSANGRTGRDLRRDPSHRHWHQEPAAGKATGQQAERTRARLGHGTTERTTRHRPANTWRHDRGEPAPAHVRAARQGRARTARRSRPFLATEWKRLDDNTLQFKLRQGVKFHNGEDFDGESVTVQHHAPARSEEQCGPPHDLLRH